MANKNKTNWFYVVLGLLFIVAWFFFSSKKETTEDVLVSKTVVVEHVIRMVGSFRETNNYKLSATNYEASFVIEKGNGQWKRLDSITKGDSLIVKIFNKRIHDLGDKTEEIPICSLIRNGELIYSLEDYNSSQERYSNRKSMFYIFIGLLLFLRGFQIISSKISYVLGGVGIAIIITLILLDIW